MMMTMQMIGAMVREIQRRGDDQVPYMVTLDRVTLAGMMESGFLPDTLDRPATIYGVNLFILETRSFHFSVKRVM